MMKRIVKFIFPAAAFILLFAACVSEASISDIEKGLIRIIEDNKAVVKKAKDNHRKGDSSKTEIEGLRAKIKEIKAAHFLLTERFRKRDEQLKQFPRKAQDRHRAMTEAYTKAMEEYLRVSEQLSADTSLTSPLDKGGVRGVETLETLLNKIHPKKKRPILGTLPYKNLSYPSKEPSTGPAILPAYKGGNKAVSPDDTKDTEEAPITVEIATLAQSLNWNPVSIYEYVKNNIETDWYWGCMKGAEETLHQKSGNDCDQSTLLTSLLRASGFPTRYVRGTIEFFPDIEKAKNITGIEDPWKLAEFFQKAGIPYTPIISGGKISNLQIEHIWVESEIPYDNYRGAIIDEHGKTWLGLDTTVKIKGYTYNNPTDIFRDAAVAGQLSSLRDEYLNSIRSQTPLEYLESMLTSSGHQLTDLMRTRTLLPDVMNILPASMQFEQRRITNEYTEIPDELKHKVRFVAIGAIRESPLMEITIDTMKLSNQQVVISYEPETVEDQEIIDAYGGLDNTPAYLIRLRPVIEVNGDMVVAGQDGLPMGEDYALTIELISPNGTEKIESSQTTGNLTAIGIVAQKAISKELAEADSLQLTASRLLYQEAINHIDRWNKAENELASLLHLTITRPIPTVVTVGSVIDVTYILDTPHGYEWKGVYVDASKRAVEITPSRTDVGITPSTSFLPQGGDENRKKTFMQLSALQGSILENRIFEDDFRVDSISTAKLFEIVGANCNAPETCGILTIDKTNISTILPSLPFDDNIKTDINNSVNQNLIATIPNREMTYKDWTGIGYVKENPATGEAGYMLSGMIAGGMTAVSPGKWLSGAMQQILQQPYSENLNVSPLALGIIFPYDGATLSVSPIDVEGIVSDPVAQVTVNGIKAEVMDTGRFIARGVSLNAGVNLITAAATFLGKQTSQTISVNYSPAQTSPIGITITYPAAGAVINRPYTIVRGMFTSSAKEISLKINGMPAEIYGNQFIINNVPLVNGDNVIIANAVDSDGAVGRTDVLVKADTTKPFITLGANITSGIPELTAYFMLTTNTPNPIVNYQMDFDGDGVVDYTGATFEDVTFTYTAEGIYYPTVTVTDDQGNTSSDTIAVTVLNKAQLDALLKEKWEGMKEKLLAGDIERALNSVTTRSKEKYRVLFTALKEQMSFIISTFTEFNILNVYDIIAEFELVANENGKLYSYQGVFIKNGHGIWKCKNF